MASQANHLQQTWTTYLERRYLGSLDVFSGRFHRETKSDPIALASNFWYIDTVS